MSLCFQRKQLLINEAEIDMYIGFGFLNNVVYIMTIVIKVIFLYENIKVLRLKKVSWIFLSAVFTVIISSDLSTECEKECVCENKHNFTILEEFGKGSFGKAGRAGTGVPCIWPGTGSLT